MENRGMQKKEVLIYWNPPRGASHPAWGVVSTQMNRRYFQLTQRNNHRELGREREKTRVLSVQDQKGSLNPMKYCCFVVYFAKFLRSCTQRKQDIWKWKKEKHHNDKHMRWKILKTRAGFVTCREFAGWKNLRTERREVEGRQSLILQEHWRGRDYTSSNSHHGPSQPTLVPEGHHCILGWWE